MNNNFKPNGEIKEREGVKCNPDNVQLMGNSLAMVYSPKQYFADLYTEDEALRHGTLFVKLYKPLEAVEGGAHG